MVDTPDPGDLGGKAPSLDPRREPADHERVGEAPTVEISDLETELDRALPEFGLPTSSDDLESTLDRALARLDAPASLAGPDPLDAALVVLRGRDAGRVYGFRGGAVLIGRTPTAHVRLDDPAVSQRHAMIEQTPGGYVVRDLGSANGTSVNGAPISEATRLSSGDHVEVVDVVLLFREGSEAPRHDTIQLDRRTDGLVLAPVEVQPYPRVHAADGVLSMSQGEERAPSVEEQVQRALLVFAYVRRHWRLLLGVPALAGVLGVLSIAVAAPPNRVEFAVSLVTSAKENPLATQQHTAPNPEREFFADASRAFAEGRLVRATLAELGEGEPDPTRIERLSRALTFERVTTTLYRGSFSDHDGEWALRFMRAHLARYLSYEIDKTLRVYQAEVSLLSNRVQETEARLELNEDELRKFREKNLRNLPEFASGRVAAAAGLEGRAGELGAEVVRLQGELALARQRLTRESPLAEAKVREAGPYQTALAEATRRLAELRAKGLGAEHPDIRQAQAEVANLKRQVDTTTRAAPTDIDRTANPEFTRLKDQVGDLQVALAAAQQARAAVGGQIGGADETMKRMPAVEAELTRLTRNLETDGALHGRLVERLRQAETQLEIERATGQARYEVMQPPFVVGIPLRSTLAFRAAVGMALGLVVAVMCAVLLELMAIARRLPVQVIEPRSSSAPRALRRLP